MPVICSFHSDNKNRAWSAGVWNRRATWGHQKTFILFTHVVHAYISRSRLHNLIGYITAPGWRSWNIFFLLFHFSCYLTHEKPCESSWNSSFTFRHNRVMLRNSYGPSWWICIWFCFYVARQWKPMEIFWDRNRWSVGQELSTSFWTEEGS